MGNDGGSIARRADLVRTKGAAATADVDPKKQALINWTLCALSRQPLRKPVVSDALGKLYNRDAVVEYLLEQKTKDTERKAPEHAVAGHLRGLKDIRPLSLNPNPSFRAFSPTDSSTSESPHAPFVCPLTQREMNGLNGRFVYLRPCGCVMSEAGLRAVDDTATCPVCATPFERASALQKSNTIVAGGDVVVLNPAPAEAEAMRTAMEAQRVEEAAKRKAAKASKSAGDEEGEGERKRRREEKAAKRSAALDEAEHATKRARVEHGAQHAHAQAPLTGISASAARIAAEARAKKPVSAAVASVHGHGSEKKQGQSWLTMGTFTRYA